ncbi:unnamed protein product [Brugia pahangi]|uniref:Recombinase n=1 Tax=Brugia pahangi TaxID=6280 RepID=A0A0N4TLQ1_BRUPA|nr:unnamed protein product [Brugia pahangi]
MPQRKALKVISGYDIALENYEVIRRLLNEKDGDHSMVTILLYNELQYIKRNEKEWVGTIENIERVIRQLEVRRKPRTFKYRNFDRE